MSREDYLNEEELKLAGDLDDLMKPYKDNTVHEDKVYKEIENIMIDSKVPEYFIDWDTKNSKITGMKGLFCISFQFENRKLITMNYYVGWVKYEN